MYASLPLTRICELILTLLNSSRRTCQDLGLRTRAEDLPSPPLLPRNSPRLKLGSAGRSLETRAPTLSRCHSIPPAVRPSAVPPPPRRREKAPVLRFPALSPPVLHLRPTASPLLSSPQPPTSHTLDHPPAVLSLPPNHILASRPLLHIVLPLSPNPPSNHLRPPLNPNLPSPSLPTATRTLRSSACRNPLRAGAGMGKGRRRRRIKMKRRCSWISLTWLPKQSR